MFYKLKIVSNVKIQYQGINPLIVAVLKVTILKLNPKNVWNVQFNVKLVQITLVIANHVNQIDIQKNVFVRKDIMKLIC